MANSNQDIETPIEFVRAVESCFNIFFKYDMAATPENKKAPINCMDYEKDTESVKIHPTQKPLSLLMRLIEIFTDEGDVVIDPVAGSGSTLIAAYNLGRRGYGFEIKKEYYEAADRWLTEVKSQQSIFTKEARVKQETLAI